MSGKQPLCAALTSHDLTEVGEMAVGPAKPQASIMHVHANTATVQRARQKRHFTTGRISDVFYSRLVSARLCEAVQAGGPVDPAGCVQVAEETLSPSAPDLQRLLQTARHHRYRFTPALTSTVDFKHSFIHVYGGPEGSNQPPKSQHKFIISSFVFVL